MKKLNRLFFASLALLYMQGLSAAVKVEFGISPSAQFQGPCPTTLTFNGKIHNTQRGVVKYQIHYRDRSGKNNTRSRIRQLHFRQAGSREFKFSRRFNRTYSGKARIILFSPRNTSSRWQSYSVACSNRPVKSLDATRKSDGHPRRKTPVSERPVETLDPKPPQVLKSTTPASTPATTSAQSGATPLHLTAIAYPGTCLKTGTKLTLIGAHLDRDKQAQVVLSSNKDHNFLNVSRRSATEIVVALPKSMVLNKHGDYHIGLQGKDTLQWISNQLPLPKPCVK